jgi:hypothetical protein
MVMSGEESEGMENPFRPWESYPLPPLYISKTLQLINPPTDAGPSRMIHPPILAVLDAGPPSPGSVGSIRRALLKRLK